MQLKDEPSAFFRRKRNPTSDHSVRAIAWTVGITALTAATGAIVVWYVNKRLAQQQEQPKPAIDVQIKGQWPSGWFSNQPGSQVA